MGNDENGFGKAHQQVIHPAAEIPGQRADHDAGGNFKNDGSQTNQQGNLPAIDRARQDVAANGIGAEPMRGGGRLECQAGVVVVGVFLAENETAATLPGEAAALAGQSEEPNRGNEHPQTTRERESCQAQAGHDNKLFSAHSPISNEDGT